MLRALVVDNALWKQHIMLDKETGLDPPGGEAVVTLTDCQTSTDSHQ